MREGAATEDRRVRLLHRLWPRHFRKIDHFAVLLGLGLCPDLLHRLDALAHQLEPRAKLRPVIGHFLGIPPAARHGDLREVGMCECSGAQTDPNPRASSAWANSIAGIA